MGYYIGCDAHKRYSKFVVLDESAKLYKEAKVEHSPGAIRNFLQTLPEPSPVAIEATGNWYWIVDEIEQSGSKPLLTHAAKAKLMMGQTNKTDKLDGKGLAILLKAGTLPTVWIPPCELRDERELHRSRMVFSKIRTSLKNRVHATLAKYAITIDEATDIFKGKGREFLTRAMLKLPQETKSCLEQTLKLLDDLQRQIDKLEERIRQRSKMTHDINLLKTLPGVGDILAVVIEREMGTVDRFPDNEQFAGYCGTVPKVKSTGGRTSYGKLRADVNRYLKWAFIEAANVVAMHQNTQSWQQLHVVTLYKRIRSKKGHPKAIGAVARHLSEAAFWMLKKGEPYKEPKPKNAIPNPRKGFAKAGLSAR